MEHAELMASQGITSTRYESWATNLKAMQGTIRKRIIGAFARVLGDKTVEWMTQVNLEHLPGFASDQSIALIASERQLDTSLGESPSAIAARAPYWLQLARFSGTGLGILLGLHFSGYDGAVLVQQNGRALSLTLPLPPFILGQAWDPTPNLVVQNGPVANVAITSNVTPPTNSSAGRLIPGSAPWSRFDDNTDFSSRFSVVFPGGIPRLTAYGTATFTGVEDGTAAHPWPLAPWNAPFLSAFTAFDVMTGIPKLTGTTFPVICSADLASLSGVGVRVQASYPFTGTVDVKAIVAPNTSTIKSVITKWRPAKATCVGVYEHRTSAGAWGWPVQKWGSGIKWGATSVNQLIGSF